MLRQLRFEIFKMSRRPRSYIGFAALLLINMLVIVGIMHGGMVHMGQASAERQGLKIVGSPLNAEFVSWTVIGTPFAAPIMGVFLPFFVCLIFGELFAGETADGTLRTVLTRPITRAGLFFGKLTAGMLYAAGLVAFLGVSAYALGYGFFGRGGLLVVGTFTGPSLTWFNEGEGLIRLGLAYGLAFAAVLPVGMVAFLISTWLGNAMGAIGSAIMLLFVMLIVGSIPYFEPIKDYLFSTHLMDAQKAFADPIPWAEIRTALACQLGYVAGLLALALLIFRGKDVLA